MSTWTWKLYLQARGELEPSVAFDALQALGMVADTEQRRIRLLDGGEVDVVEPLTGSRQSAAERVRAGDQIQTIYRDENMYISVERLFSETFDCIIFGWTEALLAAAPKTKNYRLAIKAAARQANARIAITTTEPPDEWVGLIACEAGACRIRTSTSRGSTLGPLEIEQLKTGATASYYPPHPEFISIGLE